MRVPLAASMDRGRRDAFADRLAELTRAEPAPRAEEPAPAAEQPAADEPAPERETEPEPAAREQAPAATADQAALAQGPVATPDSIPSRGEPERRITAEEGSGAPLVSPASARPRRSPTDAGPFAAIAPRTVVATATPVAAAPIGANGTSATGMVAGNGGERAAVDAAAPLRAPAAKAAVAGYRLVTPQAAQLDAQARDSVFKQILFKLGRDGGEMRLRLEPPELGELDLHLVVENGNALRLSIGTERQDLCNLLQGGLADLQRQLEAAGLSVAHAEVHARQHGSGSRADAQPAHARNGDGAADDDDAPGGSAAPRIGTGWFTAQGLDFWV